MAKYPIAYKEYPTYKTERNWALAGYLVNDGAKGIDLYSSRQWHVFTYYAPEQVHQGTEEELYNYFQPERERNNKRRRNRRRLAKERAEEQARLKKLEEEQEAFWAARRLERDSFFVKMEETKSQIKPYLLEYSKQYKSEHDGKGRTLVIDTETTGLDCKYDDILQLSIIDEDKNVLFNSYFKPDIPTWKKAQAINGITPDMVAAAPKFADKLMEINKIISTADTILIYNVDFDYNFLYYNGVVFLSGIDFIDVMIEYSYWYAKKYHQINEYGNFRWQKLSTAAYSFNYEYQAHNSLDDVLATLFVYQHVLKEEAKEKELIEEQEEAI